MKKLAYEDLVDKMINSKTPTTQKWDVLCSYDINKVNEIFVREHAKKPLLANTKFTVRGEIGGVSYTQSYDITLGTPTLTFLEGQKSQCNVELPIDQGSKVTTTIEGRSSIIKFPEGYTIKITVPLVNIKGDGTISTSGEVIVFGQKDESLVLHFNTKTNIGDTISYEPTATDPSLAQALDGLLSGFKKNITDVDYVITTVKKDSASGMRDVKGIPLTPKSFIFTSSGQDNDPNDHGALHLWIQTNESGNGVGIVPDPVFQIGIDRYSPIPLNCTASCIFAEDVIKLLYLHPTLQHVSALYKYIDVTPGQDIGIGIALSPPSYSKDYSTESGSFLDSVSFNCDKLMIEYDSNPIFVNLVRNKVQVQWHWSQTLNYEASETRTPLPDPMGVGPVTTTQKGGTKATASIDKSDFITVKDSSFQVNISISDNDVQVTTEYVPSDIQWWEKIFLITNYNNQILQGDIKIDVKKSIGSFSIDLGALNFFAEANIIFNVQAFHAKDLSVTGEVLLVGDINDPGHEVSLAGEIDHSSALQHTESAQHFSCCAIL